MRYVLLLVLVGCGGDPFESGPLVVQEDAAVGGGDEAAPDEKIPTDPPEAGGGDPDAAEGGDGGQDAPPPEAGQAPDPADIVCGRMVSDGKTPAPPSFWASVSHPGFDGGLVGSYCDAMTSTTPPAAYTCADLLAVWSCPAWLGAGATLGCRPNADAPSVLQVDCLVP